MEVVRLHTALCERSVSSQEILDFLCTLLQAESGPIVLVWDNAPIHSRRKIAAFLAKRPRLHVFTFPKYAPELNPVEYVWSTLHSRLSNHAPLNMSELRSLLHSGLRRIRRSNRLLHSCLRASHLKLS